MKLKKLEIALSVAVMGLMVSSVQAADLINFSNGAVADADDVNHNFTELEQRINNIELAKGPAEEAGKGIEFHSWVGFDASAGWASKTFIVTQSNGGHDKEVRSYSRTPIDATTGTGTIEMTRHRTLGSDVVRHDVLNYRYSESERALTQILRYETDGTTLVETIDLIQGVQLQTNAMGVGLNWASSTEVMSQLADGSAPIKGFAIDDRSLLYVDKINVLGQAYEGCQKVLIEQFGSNLWGNRKIINWYCPNNVGLVKQVYIEDGAVSKMLEFEQLQSDAIVTIQPIPGPVAPPAAVPPVTGTPPATGT